MVWQTMFADDDVSESEFSVCVKIWICYVIYTSFFVNKWIFELNENVIIYIWIIMK